MEGLKGYLLAVCSAAILCAILKQLVGNGKMSSATVHLLSGLFVSICIISPWKDFSLQDLELYNPLQTQGSELYVETGKQITQKQINGLITDKTEAYILEKANQMNVQVGVRVELSDDGLPVRSVITGRLSQEEKKELSAFLLNELGIKKEMQLWR